jgi:WS/DGAT/MGAT family acyltransferase
VPRPAPSSFELLRDEMLRYAQLPLRAVGDLGRLLTQASDARREVLVRARALAQTLGATLRPASSTPLNSTVGPHRRFDWMTMELDTIKQVRRELGGSLNDVVLTIVTGAVRRFMQYRRVDPAGLDFRIMAPVSVRDPNEQGRLGNRVSAWIVPLPLDLSQPASQLRAISARTEELKNSKSAVAAEALTQAAEWTPATLLSLGARNATRLLPFNMVVTNVPGPQLPLYMLGARMREIFPLVPLMDHLGLGIALFSYDGQLCWGFNADYELVPDLDHFVRCVAESFEDVQRAAGLTPEAKPAPRRRKKTKSEQAARTNGSGAPAS